jgi:hypothetical protein
MAIGAAHLSLEHRMMVRQFKGGADIGVALETGVGRLARIDDLAPVAAALDMETAGAMARLASHRLGVVALRLQPRVRRSPEIPHDYVVTSRAFLRPNEFRAGDAGGRHDGVARFKAAAGKKNESESDSASGQPPEFLPLAATPFRQGKPHGRIVANR